MKSYIVEWLRTVIVEAKDKDEALDKAREAYAEDMDSEEMIATEVENE